MKQCVKFTVPILKKDGSGSKIEVGDDADLILLDGTTKTVEVTEVSDRKTRICWDLDADGVPRAEDVMSIDGSHQLACDPPPDLIVPGSTDGFDPVFNPDEY